MGAQKYPTSPNDLLLHRCDNAVSDVYRTGGPSRLPERAQAEMNNMKRKIHARHLRGVVPADWANTIFD
jgi:hypothetical protein